MLGRLGMSVGDCIDAYTRLSDEVFQKKHYLPIKLSGQTQARFDTKALEDAVRKIVSENSTPSDENLLLRDTSPNQCRV